MLSTRPARLVSVLFLLLVPVAAACGGGGPSRDDFLDAANAVCVDSNEETEDIDPPESLEDAIAYADDAKEVVADRVLDLDEVEVSGDDEEAFTEYLDSLEEERDALIELAGADAEDGLEALIGEVKDLEDENRELADDLDLDDCGEAAEGETVALALEAPPDEPEPVPDPEVDPEGDPDLPESELGDDPLVAIQNVTLPDQGIVSYSGENQEITDDSGALQMSVPVEWIDVDGSPSDDGTPNLDATPDIDAFEAGFTVPGALFAATTNAVDLQELLTRFTPGACSAIGQGNYTDGVYTGRFQVGIECGGTSTAVMVVAADADDGTHTVLVQIGVT